MKYKTITSYDVNKKNPFVNDVLEIDISTRRKLMAGKSPSMVVNEDGEVIGNQVFAILEKVDKEQFTKIFRKGLAGMFGLSKSGIRVFSYIASIAKPNKDLVLFDMDDCKKYTGYKTHPPVNTGLSELIENKFIARSKKHYLYYINPTMFFNGSRVAFVKMYQVDDNKPIEPNKSGLLE